MRSQRERKKACYATRSRSCRAILGPPPPPPPSFHVLLRWHLTESAIQPPPPSLPSCRRLCKRNAAGISNLIRNGCALGPSCCPGGMKRLQKPLDDWLHYREIARSPPLPRPRWRFHSLISCGGWERRRFWFVSCPSAPARPMRLLGVRSQEPHPVFFIFTNTDSQKFFLSFSLFFLSPSLFLCFGTHERRGKRSRMWFFLGGPSCWYFPLVWIQVTPPQLVRAVVCSANSEDWPNPTRWRPRPTGASDPARRRSAGAPPLATNPSLPPTRKPTPLAAPSTPLPRMYPFFLQRTFFVPWIFSKHVPPKDTCSYFFAYDSIWFYWLCFFSSNLLFLACLVKYLKLPPVAIMLCLFSLNLFGLQVWFRRPQKYLPVQAVWFGRKLRHADNFPSAYLTRNIFSSFFFRFRCFVWFCIFEGVGSPLDYEKGSYTSLKIYKHFRGVSPRAIDGHWKEFA